MILRRFMSHIKDQNWFAVGLDVVVVIVGIFLGMQVTDWNEQRKINNQIDEYLGRLFEDLEDDIRIFGDLKNYYLTVSEYGEHVVSELDKQPEHLDAKFVINVYQATQDYNVEINQFTFNEMTANGILTEIKDIHFRRMLSQYFAVNRVIRSFEQEDTEFRIKVRRLLSTATQMAIKKSCGDQIIILENNARIKGLYILIQKCSG